MTWHALPCCHGGPQDNEQRFCSHPRLMGSRIVSPQQCLSCFYRGTQAIDGPSPHVADVDVHPYFTPWMSVPAAVERLKNQTPSQPEPWWQWPNVQAAFRQRMEDAIRQTRPLPERFAGPGIVIVGGGKYFPSAYVTIRVLRHVGCRLPIELWHLAGEIGPRERFFLEPWDVRCIDGERRAAAEGFSLHSTWWRGWQLKPFAIQQSAFREVLYLDADCYPARNPEFLFDEPAYREHGAIVWPDLEASSCLLPPEAPQIFGSAPLPDLPAEAGQLLVDKAACWRELSLALFLNAQADFTYRILWGDKDTFPIAWRRLGRTYGRLWPTAGRTPQAVLQRDGTGKTLFVHRASSKFRFDGTQFDSNYQGRPRNDHNPDLPHEDFCFATLRDLETEWNRWCDPDSTLPPRPYGGRIPVWRDRAELEESCRRHTYVVRQSESSALCRILAGPAMFVDPREQHIARYFLSDGYWESWITLFLSRRIWTGMHCVDVGANFGYFTALFADRIGPAGRVLAVEPQPHVCEFLRRSIAANRWTNVTAAEMLVGDAPGEATLWMGGVECGNASCRRELCPGEFTPVACTVATLDSLLADWPRVDLIKIDAEGAEMAIWSGMRRTVERHRPEIVLEFSAARYADARRFVREIREFYPRFQAIDFDGELRDLSEAEILDPSVDYWMLYLSPQTREADTDPAFHSPNMTAPRFGSYLEHRR